MKKSWNPTTIKTNLTTKLFLQHQRNTPKLASNKGCGGEGDCRSERRECDWVFHDNRVSPESVYHPQVRGLECWQIGVGLILSDCEVMVSIGDESLLYVLLNRNHFSFLTYNQYLTFIKKSLIWNIVLL